MSITIPNLDEAVAANTFSGLATVHHGTDLTFSRAEGMAHRALGVPNTADTRFAIASGAKAFTALGAMRLVERGILDLDQPVREYLGADLPLIDAAVTLRHLLTHTSGIGDYLDESDAWDQADYVMPVPVHSLATTEGYVPILDGHPQEEPPGVKFRYNNGGFVVAALVIERASGTLFHDLVDSEVCVRAGLRQTAFLRSDDLPGDAALGYMDATGNRTNVLHLPVRGSGDGGVYSTADDLVRFWMAIADGRIVSTDSVTLMTTPTSPGQADHPAYGMGFWLDANGPAWNIEGADAGVSFRSTHDPESGVTATVFGNTFAGGWPVVRALSVLFGTPE